MSGDATGTDGGHPLIVPIIPLAPSAPGPGGGTAGPPEPDATGTAGAHPLAVPAIPYHPATVTAAPADEFVLATGPTQTLTVRYFGRRHPLSGILVELNTNHGALAGLTVELHHAGRLFAHAAVRTVGPTRKRVVLRRAGARRYPPGQYVLTVTRGKTLLHRSVVVGGR